MAEPAATPPRKRRVPVLLLLSIAAAIVLVIAFCRGPVDDAPRGGTVTITEEPSTAVPPPPAPAASAPGAAPSAAATAPTADLPAPARSGSAFRITPLPELTAQPWPGAYRRTVAYNLFTDIDRYLGGAARIDLRIEGHPERVARDGGEVWLWPRASAVIVLRGRREDLRRPAAAVGEAVRAFLAARTGDPDALTVEIRLADL